MKTNRRKLNKKAAAALMALMMTCGAAAAPLSEGGSSIVPLNITTAEAAQTVNYDLNSTATYKALTKAKVQALYRAARTEVGTYNRNDSQTSYKLGKEASQKGSWYEGELSPDLLKSVENNINLYRTLCGLYNVTLESGSLYQKGALVRSTFATFDHDIASSVQKPAGMSNSIWNTGKNCNNWILAYNTPPLDLAYGWISEKDNVMGSTNTGHRMTILNSSYSTIKLGYACGTALGYADQGTSRMKEAAATFPSAGYMPTEMVDASAPAPWMIQLNTAKLKVTNINNVKVTISGGGRTYTRTKTNGGLRLGNYARFYGAEYLEYTKPDIANNKSYSGSYTVTVTGLTDAYTGKAATLKYTINFFSAKDPEKSSIGIYDTRTTTTTLSQKEYYYDGKAKIPTVTIKVNGTTLKQNTDYTVSYRNNTNVGTATVFIAGKGKYYGWYEEEFTIKRDTRKDISKCTASLSASSFYYNGKYQTPSVTVKNGSTVLKNGTDYTVNYTTCKDVGTATVTITGKGNYKGTLTKSYKIVKDTRVDLSKCTVTLGKSVAEYDGKAQKPAVTVKYGSKALKAGTDYTVSYQNNINVGTAKVTVTGKGSYKGTVNKTFRIATRIRATEVQIKGFSNRNAAYTGKAVAYKTPIYYKGQELKEGVDYEYTGYDNNIKPGKATAHLKFIGKYTGAIYYNFTVTDKIIAVPDDFRVTKKKTYAYNGSPVEPEMILKYKGKPLTLGKDYTMTYKNSDKPGTATAYFLMQGDFIGTMMIKYEIV